MENQQCTPLLSAVDDALYVIGGKWKLRVITALLDHPARFNEIQRLVQGISATVLSTELKALELNGFVKKAADTYILTAYSHTLYEVVMALGKWGKLHAQTIRAK